MFKKLFPILAISLVNVIGYSVLLPVLPSILNSYVPQNQVGFYFGFFITAYSLSQFLVAPLLGSLSDKYGRRKILLFSQIGTSISWAIFAFAFFISDDVNFLGVSIALLVLIFSRIIDGLTAGDISVSNAWIADTTSEQERASAYGLIGGVFGIGLLAGPLLGGIIATSPLGFFGIAGLAFACAFSAALITFFGLKESLPLEKRLRNKNFNYLEEINIFKQIKKFKGNFFVEKTLNLRLFFSITFASFFTILIIELTNLLDISPLILGFVVTAFALITGLMQVFILPKIHDKFGARKSLSYSIIFFVIGLFILPFLQLQEIDFASNHYPLATVVFILCALILNLAISLAGLAFKTIFTSSVKETEQGLIQGIDESLIAFGNGITPILAGITYQFFGVRTFWLFGIVIFIAVILFMRKNRK